MKMMMMIAILWYLWIPGLSRIVLVFPSNIDLLGKAMLLCLCALCFLTNLKHLYLSDVFPLFLFTQGMCFMYATEWPRPVLRHTRKCKHTGIKTGSCSAPSLHILASTSRSLLSFMSLDVKWCVWKCNREWISEWLASCTNPRSPVTQLIMSLQTVFFILKPL